MNEGLRNRLAGLFGACNGHSQHPLDKWLDWIRGRHPELVNQLIDEVNSKKNLIEEDLPAAYIAMGSVCLFTGSQFYFDVVTGAIFGEGHEPYEKGTVLHNIEQVRERAHGIVDQLFDQYKQEYEENEDQHVKDYIGEGIDDTFVDYDWNEVDNELEDEE